MNNAVSYMIINDLKPIFLPVIAFALSVHNPRQFFHSKPSVFKNLSTLQYMSLPLVRSFNRKQNNDSSLTFSLYRPTYLTHANN